MPSLFLKRGGETEFSYWVIGVLLLVGGFIIIGSNRSLIVAVAGFSFIVCGFFAFYKELNKNEDPQKIFDLSYWVIVEAEFLCAVFVIMVIVPPSPLPSLLYKVVAISLVLVGNLLFFIEKVDKNHESGDLEGDL